ncbi:MAG TPA: D-alanine--D-alanine ligase [Oligoflexia bacterium]|nr:D-alanine--D-alanine ligase [Oligoflexia bacterium]HMR24293.1 D-alanine--D-alanine ligase [Oligoflexia bacterium]
MKILILFSEAHTSNREDLLDTMLQVKEIKQSLHDLGYTIDTYAFSSSLGQTEETLKNIKPDCVFNLVESIDGRDANLHCATSLLEFLNLPYTGCPSYVLSLLNSKVRHKKWLQQLNLPTPDFLTFTDLVCKKPMLKLNQNDLYMIKSDTEHGSLGLNNDSVVQGKNQILQMIMHKKEQYKGDWFAEKFIVGREFNISMLEQAHTSSCDVLPIAEMQFVGFPDTKHHIVDYEAKWHENSWVSQATQRSFVCTEKDKNLFTELKKLSKQCWDNFALRGAARVDVRVDEDGKPWILEINPNPCLTKDAGFMAAAQQMRLNHKDVIERLIQKRID